MPPSYNEWTGDDERFGYLSSMVIGVDSPNGFDIGRVVETDAFDSWAITGDTNGLDVKSSGMIYISDNSLITTTTIRTVAAERTRGGQVASTTIQIQVFNDSSDAAFYSASGNDSDDGRQPHKPKLSLVDAESNIRVNTYYRRGDTFNGTLINRTNKHNSSYGDPVVSNPLVRFDSSFSATVGFTYDAPASGARKANNSGFGANSDWTLQDIDFDGNNQATVIYNLTASGRFSYLRSNIKNNLQDNDASGVRLDDVNNGGILRFISTTNVDGDGIYGTRLLDGTSNYEFGWCDLSTPTGGVADNIQITHENKVAQQCFNVWIHNCLCEQSVTSESTKGSIVVEGTSNYLIEDCIVDGKYFGVAAAGDQGTVRKVEVRQGGLPLTNPNNVNTWGIGVGADDVISRLSIYDNNINGTDSLGTNTINRGLLISGFNLTGLDKERYDMEIGFNAVANCLKAGLTTEPWSGYITDFTSYNNTANSEIINNGSVATQGTYQSQDVDTSLLGGLIDNSIVTIAGTPEEGEVLTASTSSVNTFVSRQWRLNGVDLSGETASTYTVAAGTAVLTDDRRPKYNDIDAAEISCVITVADSGNHTYLYSDYVKILN